MEKNYKYERFQVEETIRPDFTKNFMPVELDDETMNQRKEKVLAQMKERKLDCILVYGDLEHGSNFEYLTGFLTRFEESVLILHQDGSAYLLLGNENTKMVQYSRIKAELIHVPFFSLPNQPMDHDAKVDSYLKQAGLKTGMNIGIVGWKNFTSKVEDNHLLFDVPNYLVDAIKTISTSIINCCNLFIGEGGVRTVNNANEIAHYEAASSLASSCMMEALDQIEIGKKEYEIATYLNRYGQKNSVVTICATGDRFANANLYPGEKEIKLGDKMSLTVGYKGGLSSRAGYAVHTTDELPTDVQDYIEKIAAPYFCAITAWLEQIHIGMSGKELYNIIEEVLPKDCFHWHLNPGHLLGDEEWMSSPVYPDSMELLKSGMIFQTDIIPSLNGYGGVSCESGIVLANHALQTQIEIVYPQLWETIQKRRFYMKNTLGIQLSDDVLPMNDTVAYYRPFFLNKNAAFVKK